MPAQTQGLTHMCYIDLLSFLKVRVGGVCYTDLLSFLR